MKIGFDAKRAFLNNTGLGNYSRFVIQTLAKQHSQNEYALFTPYTDNVHKHSLARLKNAQIITPSNIFNKSFPNFWRNFNLPNAIRKHKIEVFHGLSNELPRSIKSAACKKIVTIHDLIFMRYPHYYKAIDRRIYINKVIYACKMADTVIAASEQTKRDLQEFFKVPEQKIEVIYQDCNPLFYGQFSTHKLEQVLKDYKLDDDFILSVGTIERRKNQLTLVKALAEVRKDFPLKLVLIGKKMPYCVEIEKFAAQQGLQDAITYMSFVSNEDLPYIYKLATAFVYPSVYEGFGIPVLEAANVQVPVITTACTSMQEIGHEAFSYFDGQSAEDLAAKIKTVVANPTQRDQMRKAGLERAQKFRGEVIGQQIIQLYQR